jgi:hypothetical protein
MRTILAKLATRRAMGLFIGDKEVTLSHVAFTPAGPIEVARRSEPVGTDPIDTVLNRVLAQTTGKDAWRSAPLAVGLPVLRLFFSTRPIKSMNLDASPQTLLHEVLQSSNLVIDDMEVDMIKSQPGKQAVASITATQKRYIRPILDGLEACGRRPTQVEPAPFALLRSALRRHRTPRRARSALRIFLGAAHGLGILTAMDSPLAWRYFALRPGTEGTEIASIVSSMRTLSRYYGVEPEPDLVMVHGRPDLHRLEDTPEWPRGQIRMRRSDAPAFDPAETAFGLALGCHAEEAGFNLARSLKPRVSVYRVVPVGQAAVQLGALAVASFLLQGRHDDYSRQLLAVRTSAERPAWFKDQSSGDLEKERAQLATRTESLQRYLGGRILWSNCLHDVAAFLPATMTSSAIQGHAKLGEGKHAEGPIRSLALSMRAPITGGGVVPPEVDAYVSDLRASQVLRKSLPQIRLLGLHWVTDEQDRKPYLAFTVNCQSEPEKKAQAKP